MTQVQQPTRAFVATSRPAEERAATAGTPPDERDDARPADGRPAADATRSDLDATRPDLDATRPDLDDRDGFAAWVEPHWPAMARLAARSGTDPDDVLADALADAWRKRAQFDPGRGSARSWLLAITADQRRKAWRRAARLFSRTTVLPDDGIPGAGPSDPGTSIDLERALGRLSARQRLAVDLHYFLGLGVSEAAEVMRCSPGTVKSTLSDARGRLRALLGEDYR